MSDGKHITNFINDFRTLIADNKVNDQDVKLSPHGIWSDGVTMWVANRDPETLANNKVFAYNMETKARDHAKDIAPLEEGVSYSANEFRGGI